MKTAVSIAAASALSGRGGRSCAKPRRAPTLVDGTRAGPTPPNKLAGLPATSPVGEAGILLLFRTRYDRTFGRLG